VASSCFECFSDDALIEYIQRNGATGDCSFCGAENTLTILVSSLEPLLEAAISCIVQSEDGKPLIEILEKDLRIFSDKDFDKIQLTSLLVPDYSIDNLYKFNFELDINNEWQSYRKEIVYNNRYFPAQSLSESLFNHIPGSSSEALFISFLSTLTRTYSEFDVFWRARTSKVLLADHEMSKPPPDLTTGGRANPAGIPYLYMASTPDTAIGEVRPHPGSYVSVANCMVGMDKKIQVLDLCMPSGKASILKYEEEQIPLVIRILNMLEIFGKELSKPVLPDKSQIDYVPTQYLCEFLKRQTRTQPDGTIEPLFDGIRYQSSLSSHGHNIVLFNDKKINIGNPELYSITGTNVTSKKITLL
jgi:hypothetical protein